MGATNSRCSQAQCVDKHPSSPSRQEENSERNQTLSAPIKQHVTRSEGDNTSLSSSSSVVSVSRHLSGSVHSKGSILCFVIEVTLRNCDLGNVTSTVFLLILCAWVWVGGGGLWVSGGRVSSFPHSIFLLSLLCIRGEFVFFICRWIHVWLSLSFCFSSFLSSVVGGRGG